MATFSTTLLKAFAVAAVFAVVQSTAFAQFELPQPPNGQQLGATHEEEFPGPPGSPPTTLEFGTAVAVDDATAFISLPAFAAEVGRVAIFTRDTSGTWSRTGTLDSPNQTAGTRFGERLALDGKVALVGTPQTVYVYRRMHGTWKLVQTLRPATGERLDGALAVESESLLVGATVNGRGIVHVLAPSKNGLWHRTQELRAGGGGEGDAFGQSLAVSHGTLVVGAAGFRDGQGAAFVYEHFRHFWFPYAKLVASDRRPGDGFGTAVATNGNLIAVGAPNANLRDAEDGCGAFGASGEAYVFARDKFRWAQRDLVLHPRSNCVIQFAGQVAIDRDYLVASTPSLFPFQQDGAIIYRRTDNAYQAAFFVAPSDEGLASLAFSRRTLLIGFPFERPFSIGQALIFELEKVPR